MTGITSPITDAWMALDPSVRAQAEKIAGANRQMSWPETLLVIATAIVEERERCAQIAYAYECSLSDYGGSVDAKKFYEGGVGDASVGIAAAIRRGDDHE